MAEPVKPKELLIFFFGTALLCGIYFLINKLTDKNIAGIFAIPVWLLIMVPIINKNSS